ncbi:MAG: nitroreductase family protein [Candidatus Omnitrophica bacterium]|nr:nitroreductase family protein [Candidatus Omnitrophota bacterium]
MSLFTINKEKCKGDGACVMECPLGLIVMDANAHVPVPREGAESVCINCGHCVAVCPHGAFSLALMPVEECRELSAGWNLSAQKIETFFKGRRSVRIYKKDIVPRETFEKLIDIARYAPSGINRQPVRWIVIHDPAQVQKIADETINWMRSLVNEQSPMAQSLHMQSLIDAWEKGKDLICRQAPHLILTYALKDDMTASGACTIATTYLELAAVSFGLGTCWAGYVNMALNFWPNAKKLAGIPAKASCFSVMMIGYPKLPYFRVPLRNPSRITWG